MLKRNIEDLYKREGSESDMILLPRNEPMRQGSGQKTESAGGEWNMFLHGCTSWADLALPVMAESIFRGFFGSLQFVYGRLTAVTVDPKKPSRYMLTFCSDNLLEVDASLLPQDYTEQRRATDVRPLGRVMPGASLLRPGDLDGPSDLLLGPLVLPSEDEGVKRRSSTSGSGEPPRPAPSTPPTPA
eukprot:SAG22_NODE_869_length_6749_cov_3.048120_6_plen_186_part_00